MLNNILMLFFIMLSHSSSIRGMSEANNAKNEPNWEAVAQEFTPALLEILSKTNEPISYWLERFPKNTKTFIENIHIDGNLRRLIDWCFHLKFTSEEVSRIVKSVMANIEHLERGKRHKTLRYFKSIIKNRNKPISTELVKKLNKLRDQNFVQSLNHSIIIDEKTGKTGLMLAIETKNFQIFDLFLKYYIEQNCSLSARDYNGKDALWYAFQSQTPYIIQNICNALQTKLQNSEKIYAIKFLSCQSN